VHGLINLDFADVRTIMNEMGMALMGTGIARGEGRAREAACAAISSPLLEDLSIDGARGVLINITGGPDMTLFEVNEASTLVQEAAHEDANIIFGAVIDENVAEGELRVTVIATGLEDDRDRRTSDPRPRRSHAIAEQISIQAAPEPAAPVARAVEPALPLQPARRSAGTRGAASDDFVSPFEDELDVPAFIRQRQKNREDEAEPAADAEALSAEGLELPAFLRRSAD
jgi:cell division protein FtsZ